MRRILAPIIFIIVLITGTYAFADAPISRSDFVIGAGELLSGSAEDYPSALSRLSGFGIVDAAFTADEPHITNEEAAVILAKIFFVRCGENDALTLSTFISNYFDLAQENRKYLNIAAAINAIDYNESSLRFAAKSNLTSESAEKIINNTKKAIDNFIKITNQKIAVNIANNFKYINSYSPGEKLLITVSLNDLSEYSGDMLSIIAADKKNNVIETLKTVNVKRNKESGFLTEALYFDTEECKPDSVIEIYLFNGESLMPLTSKYVLVGKRNDEKRDLNHGIYTNEEYSAARRELGLKKTGYKVYKGNNAVYSFKNSFELVKLSVNDKILAENEDYIKDDGRFLIFGKAFENEGTYKISASFKYGGMIVDESINQEILPKDDIYINISELSENEIEIYPSGIYGDNSNGLWFMGTSWAGWSKTCTAPYAVRMNLTESAAEGAVSFKFKNLPEGKYKAALSGYNLSPERIPKINAYSGNQKVNDIIPYSKSGDYMDLGVFDFSGDNTLTIENAAQSGSSISILCIYGLRLTPVAADNEETEEYLRSGKSYTDIINSSQNASELRENIIYLENKLSISGLTQNITDELCGSLLAKAPYNCTEQFKSELYSLIKGCTEASEAVLVQSAEDLRGEGKGLYLRGSKAFALTDNKRTAYAYYELDTASVKALSFLFTKSGDKRAEIKIECSISRLPVTSRLFGIKEGAEFDALTAYFASFMSEYSKTIVIDGTNSEYTVPLDDVLSKMSKSCCNDLVIKLSSAEITSIENVRLIKYE